MKKSKIIIPAAAILALSVGASVTGTVAWFTASRTASIAATNLAAINTGGNLTVSLTRGVGTTVDGTTVNLSFLRDVSYDDTANEAYVAVLDTNGTNVLATRKLSSTERDSYSTVTVSGATWGSTRSVDVYYYNSWTAEFSTTSNANNYLLFDSSTSVSKIGTGTIAETSIYKAVRVGMTCGEKSFVWAPYTSLTESTVAHLSGEGELKASQPATTAPDYTKYVTTVAEADQNLYTLYTNVIKEAEGVVREGSSKTAADGHKGLLSTTLKSGAVATVEFKLWFEGLDPNCINGSADVTKVGEKVVKDMALGFYAVDSTTLAAA